MNRKVPEITESVEELNDLLKVSKNTTEKDRLRMLYLLKKVEKRKNAQKKSPACSVCVVRTIGQWLAKYENRWDLSCY